MRLRTATSGITRLLMSSTEPPKKQDSVLRTKKRVYSNSVQTQTVSRIEPAMADLPTFGFTIEKDVIPASVGFCGYFLHPPCHTGSQARQRPPCQNFAEHEDLKRTFHDTANKMPTKQPPRPLLVVFGGHAGGWETTVLAAWSPGSATDPAPPLSAQQAASISNWLCASLRHSIVTPRVSFCDAFDWLPQATPLHLSWPRREVNPAGMAQTQTQTPGQPTSTPFLR